MTLIYPPRPVGCHGHTGPKIGSKAEAPGQFYTHNQEKRGHTNRYPIACCRSRKSPRNREFYGLALAIFTSANLGANWMRPRRIAYVEPRLAVFRHFLPMQPLAAVG